MECHICKCVGLTQNEADRAAEIAQGFDTLCIECAKWLVASEKSEAWHTGFEAAKQGENLANNPYEKSAWNHAEWKNGFNEFGN